MLIKVFKREKNSNKILRENAFRWLSKRITFNGRQNKKRAEAMKNDLKGVENEPAANELPDYQKI